MEMDDADFWVTVAQVVPVLLVVMGVELGGLSQTIPWHRVGIPLRISTTLLIFGLGAVEVRALLILAGASRSPVNASAPSSSSDSSWHGSWGSPSLPCGLGVSSPGGQLHVARAASDLS